LTGSLAGEPLTGKTAFNAAGDRLAAFGPGQSCHVFAYDATTPSFDRIADQPPIAGVGGTALLWSPRQPQVLVAAHSQPGYVVQSFAGEGNPLAEKLPLGSPTPCVEMMATSEGRRIVALEESGRIRFLDPDYRLPMLEVRSRLDHAHDLALSSTSDRLAIAAVDGRVEIWESAPREEAFIPPKATDETAAWDLQVLLRSAAELSPPQQRYTRLDPQGRLCSLFVEHDVDKQDDNYEGALYFLRWDGAERLYERIHVDDTALDRRMDRLAMAMEIRPSGEPVVFIRRRHAEKVRWNGANYRGRRDAAGKWRFDLVHGEGNQGFWPKVVMNEAGEVAEIFHYSYGGLYLMRSSPSPSGGEWRMTPLGRQGDGANMEAWQDARGRIHFTFAFRRFSGDVSQSMYAVWDGQPPLRRYPVEGRPEPLPDGTPVIIRDGVLMRWGDGDWQPDPAIPEIPFGNYLASPDGTSYSFRFDSGTQQLFVATLQRNKWSIARLGLGKYESPSAANGFLPLFDPRGRLWIVVGRYHQRDSWVGVLRERSEP
jgi:hypothetical protein